MAFLPAEHEFGARHGGIGNLLDALGLPVEFDSDGMRCFGGGIGSRAEGRDLPLERKTGGLERAFRGLDVRLELRRPASHKFTGPGRGIAQRACETVEPLPLHRQTRGGRLGAYIGAGTGFVEGGDLVFENGFECPEAVERAIEAGIEAIELAADDPA